MCFEFHHFSGFLISMKRRVQFKKYPCKWFNGYRCHTLTFNTQKSSMRVGQVSLSKPKNAKNNDNDDNNSRASDAPHTRFPTPNTRMTSDCFSLVGDGAPFSNAPPFAPPSTISLSLVFLAIIEVPTSSWLPMQQRFETTQSWEYPSSLPLPNHQG